MEKMVSAEEFKSWLEDHLPLRVENVASNGYVYTVRGEGWFLVISGHWTLTFGSESYCWATEEPEILLRELSRLVGRDLISLNSSDNLFNPTLQFDNDASLRIFVSDDDLDEERWRFEVAHWGRFEGPLTFDE